MSPIDCGRSICNNLQAASSREWLVTNGIGGFACGTISGELTRRYHGLLIAALQPPLGRTLLATKIDEVAHYAGQDYPLFTNHWADRSINPQGYRHIQRFYLEGTTPVWIFNCADAQLEKRIWMQKGANTVYIQYRLLRGEAFSLDGKILVNYRDYHGTTRGDWQMHIEPVSQGLSLIARVGGAIPFYLLSAKASLTPHHKWLQGFSLSVEQSRGFEGLEDHLCAAHFQEPLEESTTVTLVISTEAKPELSGPAAFRARQDHELNLLSAFRHAHPGKRFPAPLQQLALAADQFIVRRHLSSVQEATPENKTQGYSVIAGYPWFGDWGRDTMISLPGLTLSTGRPKIARSILHTYAHFVDHGMIPNRFPDEGETPEYNTVDATLWYIEAVRAYHAATGDDKLLRELFPTLREILLWHQRGTRYNIHLDSQDGLLYAGADRMQLTWMDAKVGEWVVTPRIGKPVEINALWHNALRSMVDFARCLHAPPENFETLASQAQAGFTRFWYEEGDYCYDVIDGPAGDDPSLRPNQILAVSLAHSPLSREQQKAVVDVCARHLLTPYGLRSLSPNHPDYTGSYGGNTRQRDSAYHQGSVWAWLIGPFVSAFLRVYGDRRKAKTLLRPLLSHLSENGLGSISEIFDGDAPFNAGGCTAQAWSVAEVLRAWIETNTAL